MPKICSSETEIQPEQSDRNSVILEHTCFRGHGKLLYASSSWSTRSIAHASKRMPACCHITHTARCYIPTRGPYSSTASLFDMIPHEWRWVYEHNGSISGQVLIRTKNSVYILSQKDCLDLGHARGRPARSVYRIIGENRSRTDVYGQFSGIPRFNLSLNNDSEVLDLSEPKNNDAYAECVFDYSPPDTYTSWNLSRPFPAEMAQMVKIVEGGHTEKRQTLTEDNFDSSKETLNEAFRRLVDDALRNKTVNKQEDVGRCSHFFPLSYNTD